MDPRTHPRGWPPDFALPKPNPNPSRLTDALWWLVCMRLRLAPGSRDGGTYAKKPGSHNAGENLPDYGAGDARTDHSIRDAVNRRGPWWRKFSAAHDWTFVDAQRGDYRTIELYTKRLLAAMRDPADPRPDLVYHYTLGQADGDPVVEGWHELRDEVLGSSDLTHLWHRHDSFLRSAVGDWWAMWAALTIDMGWTVAEWRRSTTTTTNRRTTVFRVKADDASTRYISTGVTSRRIPNMDADRALEKAGVPLITVKTTAAALQLAGPIEVPPTGTIDYEQLVDGLTGPLVAALRDELADVSDDRLVAAADIGVRRALGSLADPDQD